jgi:hypothetical protein
VTAAVAEPAAERAVAMLAEMSADLRACAIVGDGGAVVASSAEAPWGEQAAALWEAIEGEGAAPASQVHVATESGEVFAAREGGVTAIALTDRFALESLMFCDLRAALRELGRD